MRPAASAGLSETVAIAAHRCWIASGDAQFCVLTAIIDEEYLRVINVRETLADQLDHAPQQRVQIAD
ncbi:MAG TPA: hypothetical protein PKA74_19760, partial [Bauldia sp.]|nr:hypothetical protein [Bauldia sp.]